MKEHFPPQEAHDIGEQSPTGLLQSLIADHEIQRVQLLDDGDVQYLMGTIDSHKIQLVQEGSTFKDYQIFIDGHSVNSQFFTAYAEKLFSNAPELVAQENLTQSRVAERHLLEHAGAQLHNTLVERSEDQEVYTATIGDSVYVATKQGEDLTLTVDGTPVRADIYLKNIKEFIANFK